MEPAAMADASGLGAGLLSFEFFLRCKLLILSDSDLLCPFVIPISEPWWVKGDLLVAVRVDLGFEFRLVDLRKLLLLRSLLCEGAKMIPQPGAAMLVVWGVLVLLPSVGKLRF